MRRGLRVHSEDGPDEPLDPALRAGAAAYNEPPAAVPREAIWQRIQATRTSGVTGIARGAGRTERRSSRGLGPPVVVAADAVGRGCGKRAGRCWDLDRLVGARHSARGRCRSAGRTE